MKTLKEIEARALEIRQELDKEDISTEELDTLSNEMDDLEEEKRKLTVIAEKRSNTLKKALTIGKIKENVSDVEERKEDLKMENQEKEYRSAFLKRLQKKELTEAEERALSSATSSAGAAIPTQTLNMVMTRLEEKAPLLNEIELLRVGANVTIAVEADATEANVHTEGATINDDGDVLIPVSLAAYEITKYITISRTVQRMTIDAFESWLVDMLVRRIARKITKLIINGTGSGQAKGIDKANVWDGTTNSVKVGASASLTAKDVDTLCGLLPGGYDANAKFLMSKKTLFSDFKPLQDKSKNDIFTREGKIYFVNGYEVMIDDNVPLHEAYLGDFKMYVGNLGENITVDTDKILSKNSMEYLGCASFDGKPAIGEAFVKLEKAAE